MFSRSCILIFISCVGVASPASAASAVQQLKLTVTNPSGEPRPREAIVIPLSELRERAPGLSAAHLVVTATDARTLEEDAAILRSEELPSQVDDLDGDGKLDELAFQVDLAPRQTRMISIAVGDPAVLTRLRAPYERRTNALVSRHFEGPGWESETVAWRLYGDPRNAIDVFGKRRPGLWLERWNGAEYDYHAESPLGRDIYKIGTALGIGSVAAWNGTNAEPVRNTQARDVYVRATGPVRAVVELVYGKWRTSEKAKERIDVRSRITQWAGERGFEQRVTASAPITFVTALPVKPGVSAQKVEADSRGLGALWTWGAQVLEPGATATASLPDQNLGLAIIGARGTTAAAPDAANHLFPFAAGPAARWWVLAAWDQEDAERLTGHGSFVERGHWGESRALFPTTLRTADAFQAYVRTQRDRFAAPATRAWLSDAPKEQAAPPDTWKPAGKKTWAQAVGLLRENVDRTAAAWEGRVTPESKDAKSGSGFFTEGDNVTGVWKDQKGHFWTASFWTGQLWTLYEKTRDAKYRRWAEHWNAALLGGEMAQNHDTGFMTYYSSVFAHRLTGDLQHREGGLRAAARLEQLYNPKVELAASWELGGDDTIIDTLMNLQIWYWAAKQTGDGRWRELGLKHALRSAEWHVRPDGSVAQSVHYNPGDNRQKFNTHGIYASVPNERAVGDWVFRHTHQGFGADTTWSRGAAWALYGFTLSYEETKDPRLLETAEKVAAFVTSRLPEDHVTWYDLDDAGVHFRNRDTAAATLMALGLLHLSELTPEPRAAAYRAKGEAILQSLIDRYLTPVAAGDPTPSGLLRHGSSVRPHDGALVYGHYYLMEALLWLMR